MKVEKIKLMEKGVPGSTGCKGPLEDGRVSLSSIGKCEFLQRHHSVWGMEQFKCLNQSPPGPGLISCLCWQ